MDMGWIDPADDGLKWAKIAFESRAYAKSCKLLEELLTRDPLNFDARLLLGQAFLQRERYQQAVTHLEEAIKHAPDRADAHYQLGKAYFAQAEAELPTLRERKLAAALESFKAAIAMDEKATAALLAAGRVWEMRGQHEEALAYFKKAFAQSPGDEEVQKALRPALRRLTDPSQDLKFLCETASRAKRSQTHLALAATLWSLGRQDDAFGQLLAAACRLGVSGKVFPEDGSIPSFLPDMASDRKTLAEPRRILRKAQRGLGRVPNPRSRALWACGLSLVGLSVEAELQWETALNTGTSDTDCHILLQATLLNLRVEQRDDLLATIQPIIDRTGDAWAHGRWGITLLRLGRAAEARLGPVLN
jgi:tetratricopeptide (TPR) repeat protein